MCPRDLSLSVFFCALFLPFLTFIPFLEEPIPFLTEEKQTKTKPFLLTFFLFPLCFLGRKTNRNVHSNATHSELTFPFCLFKLKDAYFLIIISPFLVNFYLNIFKNYSFFSFYLFLQINMCNI